MIEKIRGMLNDYIGQEVVIKYNLGRNKYEKYNGVVKELYQNIFLIELHGKECRSFSYSDILTNTIKIDF